MTFREFTKPPMEENRPPAVETTLYAADLELAKDIDLYIKYLDTVWKNHPNYLESFLRELDEMRARDIEEFTFFPYGGDELISFRPWRSRWRPSQP